MAAATTAPATTSLKPLYPIALIRFIGELPDKTPTTFCMTERALGQIRALLSENSSSPSGKTIRDLGCVITHPNGPGKIVGTNMRELLVPDGVVTSVNIESFRDELMRVAELFYYTAAAYLSVRPTFRYASTLSASIQDLETGSLALVQSGATTLWNWCHANRENGAPPLSDEVANSNPELDAATVEGIDCFLGSKRSALDEALSSIPVPGIISIISDYAIPHFPREKIEKQYPRKENQKEAS
jgi:hypothetical protein